MRTDTTDHLTVDQILDGVYASTVPPGDPDDHDMLVRLADEVMGLRTAIRQHREDVREYVHRRGSIAVKANLADERLWSVLPDRT